MLRSFAPLLERHILRLCASAADAPDLLQKTLVGAVRSFPKYRGDSSLRTWLTSIAIKVVQEHFRQPGQRTRAHLAVAFSDSERFQDDLSPDRVVESRRRIERLSQLMARISPVNRLAYILYEMDGLSVRDVAKALGISVVAAKSRIFLARRTLIRASNRDPILHELAEEIGGGRWLK